LRNRQRRGEKDDDSVDHATFVLRPVNWDRPRGFVNGSVHSTSESIDSFVNGLDLNRLNVPINDCDTWGGSGRSCGDGDGDGEGSDYEFKADN